MFEKIIVCLDGSALSEQILPYIVAESRCFRSVVLLKVLATPELNIPLGIPGSPGVTMHTDAMLERYDKEAKEAPAYLERLAEPLREAGIDVTCTVLEGVPSEAIIGYAKDTEAGCIALATHGHSGLREVILGSTAEQLVKKSTLPVLVISPTSKKRQERR